MESNKANNDFSYLIGLFQTDGSLSEDDRNRGKLRLELNIKDEDIIYKITKLIKYNYKINKRERITNFGKSETIMITVNDINFRNLLKDWGIPVGKKSQTISPPIHKTELSINDYIRGLYDGDGSLGYTGNGFPYVSFVTQSEAVKEFLINFISKITSKPKKEPKRNKRDNVYNIVITKEDAVAFCENIYPENCLSINRKNINAQEIKKWKRPISMKKIESRKMWNKEQDKFILSNSIEKSMKVLNRTKESVEMRLWRLKHC